MNMLRRIMAFSVDILLLAAPFYILNWLFPTLLPSMYPWSELLGFTAGLIYFTLLDGGPSHITTLGKKLLKLQIVDAHKQPITHTTAALRYLIIGIPLYLPAVINYIIPEVGAALWLLLILVQLYLIVFNRKNNELIHDILCRTFVVITDKLPTFQPIKTAPKHFAALIILTLLMLAAVVSMHAFSDKYFFQDLGMTSAQFHKIVEEQKAQNKNIAAVSVSTFKMQTTEGVVLNVIAKTKDPAQLTQIAEQIGTAINNAISNRPLNITVNVSVISDFGLSKMGKTQTKAWTNTPAVGIMPALP